MSDLMFKVYTRKTGETKKDLRATFCERVDAVNFAYAESVGRFRNPKISVIVMNYDNRVYRRYIMGLVQ